LNSSRFSLVRKGYDPAEVERELRELNSQLIRLTEENAELSAKAKAH
jgi:hypothetical protein